MITLTERGDTVTAVIAHTAIKRTPWYLDWFLLRKLHSLLGLFPFGAFVVFHLLINSSVLGSAENYDFAASAIERIPLVILKLMELFMIFLPIIFHGFLGVIIALQSEVNTNQYNYLRNHLYVFQRVTAWILVATLTYHITMTWGMKLAGEVHVINTAFVANHLSKPMNQLIYMIFLLAAAYHLAYGLWNFACKWGICISEHSQKVVGWVCSLIGVGLLLLGWGALYGFATYSKVNGPINPDVPQMQYPMYRKPIWEWNQHSKIPHKNQIILICQSGLRGDHSCH